MDLGDPTRAVVPTLDGPVLGVLARSGRPLTVGEVAAQTTRGSEIGVRRTLGRLVEQGIVLSHQMGRNRVHELNREHVAAAVALGLADLRGELWRRLREALGNWDPKPLYSCVFGSAARDDGDVDSDIDLLVVHPKFPGERPPKADRWAAAVGMLVVGLVASSTGVSPGRSLAIPSARAADRGAWQVQLDRLHKSVFAWTGNRLQVLDVSASEWSSPGAFGSSLRSDITRDAIEIVRPWSSQVGRRAATRTLP